MNIQEKICLPDAQSGPERRNVPIDAVGISGLTYPLSIQTRTDILNTVGTWSLSVALPAGKRGTHMSRFVEVLESRLGALDQAEFRTLASQMLNHLDADSGELSVRFPYFIRKAAPATGLESWLDLDVTWSGNVDVQGQYKFRMRICVPVTTLCPCSKEISLFGAHNQRSHMIIDIETQDEIAIEEIVELAERSASSELYSLLKRPDEKLVTERAYSNPRFVEDLVREAVLLLENDPRVLSFCIEAENFESIHNHSAVARITRGASGHEENPQ